MSEFIISLCAAAIFCALVLALSSGGVGRTVSLVASLFLIAVAVGRVVDIREPDIEMLFGESGDESDENAYSASDWLIEKSATEIARSVYEYVATKYGVSGAVLVTVDDSDVGAVVLKKVTVDLTGVTVTGGVYEMEAELEKTLCCEVEVKVN